MQMFMTPLEETVCIISITFIIDIIAVPHLITFIDIIINEVYIMMVDIKIKVANRLR